MGQGRIGNKMELITKKMRLKTVAERWKLQYFYHGKWNDPSIGKAKDIYESLLKAKSEKEVNSIIGNNTWIDCSCDECKKDCQALIIFTDYEDSISLCKDCMKRAIKILST